MHGLETDINLTIENIRFALLNGLITWDQATEAMQRVFRAIAEGE